MRGELTGIDLRADEHKEVARLLQRYLPDTEVWAYGSRVKFTAKPHSDLDMVAFAAKEQSQAVANLREAFEESYLPFRVDLFVWDEVPEGFHRNIEEARVVMQEKEKTGCKFPEGWQETTIGEFCPFSYGKNLPKKVRDSLGEVPVFGSNGLVGYHSKPLIQDRGIIIGRKGTVGTVTFSSVPFWPIDTTFYISEDSHRDLRYTFYLLKSLRMEHMNADSAVPGLNRNAAHARKITIPPLPEQKAIAHILGSLDDKIELNRRMNETLEAMAQALFKSWFVDFDPVIDNALAAGNTIPDELKEKACLRRGFGRQAAIRQGLGDKRKSLPDDIRRLFPSEFVYTEEIGWIPKGWEVGLFGEYVSVKRGGSPRPIQDFLAPEGFPWVKISDATSCTSRFLKKTKQFIKPEGLNKTIQLEPGTLILSNSATPGIPIFLDLQACIHDGWLYFPEKKHFNDAYLYQLFLIIKEQLLMQGNGSVFTNLKTDILRNQKLIIPQKKIIQKFPQISKQWIQKIYLLNAEVQNISNIRDTLLSKLLAGETRIQKLTNF